ncbi:MAG: hypothetical protein KDC54_18560 [Lewinella sp.]|nr:hypothetical protein [Lewinella sp.]
MAKSKRNTSKQSSLEFGLDTDDKRVLWRTVLITSVVLAGVQVLAYVLLGKLFEENHSWLNPIRTALGLLIFWIFVTAAVRTFNRLRPNHTGIWLIVVGLSTAAIGTLVFLLGLRLWNELGDHGATLPKYSIIAFYAGGGLVASLISLIHIRVEDETRGNLLELLVIALAAVLFFWIT